MAKTIEIPSADGGRFSAYLASPAAAPAPGLVLIQYICGVNRVMRRLADQFAGLGYVVAVPDLFWRQEPDVRLIDDPAQPTAPEQEKSLALNAGFDDEKGLSDLAATLAWLRHSALCTGKVGALGYCLGGRLAYLMATRTDADCSVGYYGVDIERYLDEAGRMRAPLLLHVAERDELCPPEQQARIRRVLAAAPLASLQVYSGAGHAFALRGGRNFAAEAAELADRRSLAFLAEHLRPPEISAVAHPSPRAMEEAECIVIGAGAIGLAVARVLSRAGHEVVILESTPYIGNEISSRNNEVIHAGFLHPPASLKGRLGRIGRDALYAYCAKHDIPHRRLGKLMIATSQAEAAVLVQFAALAERNGVDDLVTLDAAGVRRIEPSVQCCAGLYSPSTGILDAHALMLSLLGEAQAAGAMLALETRVASGRIGERGLVLRTIDQGRNGFDIGCRMLVNAAGLGARNIALGLRRDHGAEVPMVQLAKGNYFSLRGPPPFRHLVVPLGTTLEAGGAFTLDLAGRGKFGPDVEWVNRIDYAVNAGRAGRFRGAIRQYFPELDEDALQPDYAGVRPRLYGPGEPQADWRILGPADHGIAGLVHLLGIESPGLTACLAIADHVAAMLA